MFQQKTPQPDQFKQQLRDSLESVTLNSRPIKIARHQNVYTCGDQDEMVYFIAMQRFRNLGLIATNLDRFLVINEKKLADYLAQIATAAGRSRARSNDSFQPRPIIRPRLFAKLAERQIESKRS